METVIILCGGRGTRINEFTEKMPKPMIEIGGRPVLWHIMNHFSHHGHKKFVLCTGYMGEQIREYFSPSTHGDVETSDGFDGSIQFSDAGLEATTGERINKAMELAGDRFIVTYGDGLSNIDVKKLLRHHEIYKEVATVSAYQPNSQYGVLTIRGGSVVKFQEKPKSNDWVNIGYFVFNKDISSYLGKDPLEGFPMQRLIERSELNAYQHTGWFHQMDTYKDWQHLNELWNSGKAPWKLW